MSSQLETTNPPTYEVVVYPIMQTVPSRRTRYICHLCLDPSNTKHTLAYGGCTGIGDTSTEAMTDWHQRITQWLANNPKCKTWPRPQTLSPEASAQVVKRFTWCAEAAAIHCDASSPLEAKSDPDTTTVTQLSVHGFFGV